jgi:acyl-CoA synthetase (AMP-forming)/AMP-acid ligase II
VSEGSTCNIAAALPRVAREQPHTLAVVYPDGRDARGKVRYTHYTYAQLDHDSDLLAAGLDAVGVGRGVRAALMVKPSLEFFALTFAIFKAGAVPVLVDPGLGAKNVKDCLTQAEPAAFIGVPVAHAARVVLGWGKGTVKTLITAGAKWFWGGHDLEQLRALGRQRLADGWSLADTRADDVAAILFTSGSTGPPKGAVYTHGTFTAQIECIRRTYDIRPGEIDLPTFPLFALFDPALGMTTIVPDMDFTKPREADPAKLVEAIEDFGVTNMFGSPALLDTLSRYGEAEGLKLSSLKRVISAGAPVHASIIERVMGMVGDDARLHTPYGATESLPVASIDSETLLRDTWALSHEGRGVCVGHPVPEAEVRVIAISDAPIARWSDDLALPDGEIGEIVVKSPMVTRSYMNRPDHTALAKMADGDGDDAPVRHRMGDLGYFDAQGRLWFCGRKAHRVTLADQTLFTVPCECIFNAHADVFRTALVGVGALGAQRPVLVVEVEAGVSATAHDRIRDELRALGAKHDQTAGIHDLLFHPGFPVDIRHNAKINRPQLAAWAAGALA